MPERYIFEIDGELSGELLATFSPSDSAHRKGHTLFTCAVGDQAQVYGLISRCEMLGLRLIGFSLISESA